MEYYGIKKETVRKNAVHQVQAHQLHHAQIKGRGRQA